MPGRRLAARLGPSWPAWAGALASVVVGAAVAGPAVGPRPISGDDVMALLARADRGIALAGDLHVDGWSPEFLLGFQQFLFYGPGFSWLVGLVRLLGLGLPSTEGALTAVAVASLVAVGPATVFLARSVGLEPRAAGIAGVLALAVDNVFGLGAQGTFTIALVPHQLAGTAFCLALGAAARTLADGRRRWVLLLATSLAAIVVTHLFSTATLAVIGLPVLAVVALAVRPDRWALARLATGGLIGAGLAAFWLVPYVAHWSDRGVVPGWTVPGLGTRLAEITDGSLLFGPYRGWLVLAGVSWAAAEGVARRRPALVAVAAPAAFFAVAHLLAARAPGFELSPHLANRGLGYAGLLAVLGPALLLADATRRWPRAGLGAALAVAALVVLGPPGGPREAVGQQPRPADELVEAAGVLSRVVPDGARFATERDFPGEIERLGLSHPDFWLARTARRDTLNVFGLELSPSPGVTSIPEATTARVAAGPPGWSLLAAELRMTGTTHLVTVREDTATALVVADDFEPVYRRGSIAVFEVANPADEPGRPPASLVSPAPPGTAVARTHLGPERQRFAFDLPEAGAVDLAIGFNRRWHATDGRGRPVVLSRSDLGGLSMQLPEGATTIELRFGPDPWEAAGLALSGLTILAAGAWLRLARHRPDVIDPEPATEAQPGAGPGSDVPLDPEPESRPVAPPDRSEADPDDPPRPTSL